MPVLDQLVYFASLYGEQPDAARRAAQGWLERFLIPEMAARRAEELSKGNQQKVQFIAAILHGPQILLMDEPFTGLDPVNLGILREAFLELRNEGRTLVFSTHQMEAAEALCESVAIVDRGRVVAGGTVAGLKRASGRRSIRLGLEDEVLPSWLSALPDVTAVHPRAGHVELTLGPGADAAGDPGGHRRPGRVGHPVRRRGTEPRDAVHRARRPVARCGDPSGRGARGRRRGTTDGGSGMTGEGRSPGRDPLLPNAGIVARREYRDRVKSPLFVASTILLMALALGVALAPVAIRYLDRQTVTRIAVVADDARLASMMIAVTDSILNVPPGGIDPATWEKPFRLEVVESLDDADAALVARELGGVMIVTRLPTGQLDITFRTERPARRCPKPARRVRGGRGRHPRLDLDPARGRRSSASSRRPPTTSIRRASRPTAASRSTRRRSRVAASSGSSSSCSCS